jgi:hypothetical protein
LPSLQGSTANSKQQTRQHAAQQMSSTRKAQSACSTANAQHAKALLLNSGSSGNT